MMPTKMSRDPRVPCRFAIALRIGERRIEGTVRNVARGGMLVLGDPSVLGPLEVGAAVRVGGALPLGCGAIDVAARIAWLRHGTRDHRGRETTAIGVQFVETIAADRTALDTLFPKLQATVLVAGFDWLNLDALRHQLEPSFGVLSVDTAEAALEYLDHHEIAVLCIGPMLTAAGARTLLEQIVKDFPGNYTLHISTGIAVESLQEFVEREQLYYLAPKPVLPADLATIVRGAVDWYWARVRQSDRYGEEGSYDDAVRVQRISEIGEALCANDDLDGIALQLIEGIRELVGADRAYCLLHDAATGTIWSQDPDDGQRRINAEGAGIVCFSSRTGSSVRLDHVGEDLRYDKETDDPEGIGSERLLCEPVLTPDHQVLSLIVAIRDVSRPIFSPEDTQAMALLAGHAAAALTPLRDLLVEKLAERARASEERDLFRDEATTFHSGSTRYQGHLLRLSPTWTRNLFGFLVAAFGATIAGFWYAGIDWKLVPVLRALLGESDG